MLLCRDFLHLNPSRFATTPAKDEWITHIRELLPEDIADLFADKKDTSVHGLYESLGPAQTPELRLGIAIEQQAARAGQGGGMRLVCCLDDSAIGREREDFEAIWNGFVRLYNLFQFLPLAFCVTQEGLQQHAYDNLRVKDKSPEAVAVREAARGAWTEVRAVTDMAVHEFLIDSHSQGGQFQKQDTSWQTTQEKSLLLRN